MPRGPKPKTVANGRKRPHPGEFWEGFAPPDADDARFRAEFDRLTCNLRSAGTLERTDPSLVVAAARLHVLIEGAWQDIRRDGMTLHAPNGVVMAHPMLGTLNTLTMRQRGLLNDMGLTPASSKLAEPAVPDDGGWEGLLDVMR